MGIITPDAVKYVIIHSTQKGIDGESHDETVAALEALSMSIVHSTKNTNVQPAGNPSNRLLPPLRDLIDPALYKIFETGHTNTSTDFFFFFTQAGHQKGDIHRFPHGVRSHQLIKEAAFLLKSPPGSSIPGDFDSPPSSDGGRYWLFDTLYDSLASDQSDYSSDDEAAGDEIQEKLGLRPDSSVPLFAFAISKWQIGALLAAKATDLKGNPYSRRSLEKALRGSLAFVIVKDVNHRLHVAVYAAAFAVAGDSKINSSMGRDALDRTFASGFGLGVNVNARLASFMSIGGIEVLEAAKMLEGELQEKRGLYELVRKFLIEKAFLAHYKQSLGDKTKRPPLVTRSDFVHNLAQQDPPLSVDGEMTALLLISCHYNGTVPLEDFAKLTADAPYGPSSPALLTRVHNKLTLYYSAKRKYSRPAVVAEQSTTGVIRCIPLIDEDHHLDVARTARSADYSDALVSFIGIDFRGKHEQNKAVGLGGETITGAFENILGRPNIGFKVTETGGFVWERSEYRQFPFSAESATLLGLESKLIPTKFDEPLCRIILYRLIKHNHASIKAPGLFTKIMSFCGGDSTKIKSTENTIRKNLSGSRTTSWFTELKSDPRSETAWPHWETKVQGEDKPVWAPELSDSDTAYRTYRQFYGSAPPGDLLLQTATDLAAFSETLAQVQGARQHTASIEQQRQDQIERYKMLTSGR